jgi:hypothetical protein
MMSKKYGGKITYRMSGGQATGQDTMTEGVY